MLFYLGVYDGAQQYQEAADPQPNQHRYHSPDRAVDLIVVSEIRDILGKAHGQNCPTGDGDHRPDPDSPPVGNLPVRPKAV